MQESRKREIRIKAATFREQCKVGSYGIIDLFKDCERLGYKLVRYPLHGTAVLGFVLKKGEDTVIFTNTVSRLSREIFTLAHEVGHSILHMEQGSSFIDDGLSISESNTEEREQEANYFAACLLIPSGEIEAFLDLEIPGFVENGLSAMDIAEMMSEFNVSFDMALNRLENLGKINASARIVLDTERSEKRVGNLLKSVGGNCRLNEASHITDIPCEYINYVIYNYNHNVIPKETLERALGYYHLNLEDISDKIKVRSELEEDGLEELIGGLED